MHPLAARIAIGLRIDSNALQYLPNPSSILQSKWCRSKLLVLHLFSTFIGTDHVGFLRNNQPTRSRNHFLRASGVVDREGDLGSSEKTYEDSSGISMDEGSAPSSLHEKSVGQVFARRRTHLLSSFRIPLISLEPSRTRIAMLPLYTARVGIIAVFPFSFTRLG